VEPIVHAVPQDARRRALHLGGQRLGERAHDRQEGIALERAIRRGVPQAREQRVDGEGLGRDGRHDLLGEHVERRVGHDDAVELPLLDGPHDRSGLQELLTLGDDDAAPRRPGP